MRFRGQATGVRGHGGLLSPATCFLSAVLITLLGSLTTRAAAEPTLRDARVAIVLSNEGCDVTSRFVIDTADPQVVDHRLMLGDRDTRPTFVVVGAVVHQDDTVGRTARLLISLTGSGRNEYTVRYRVGLADARVDRCPLLVPATPTDGLTRSVTIVVDVPRGAMKLPGEFPAFTWDGQKGRVMLGHLPAFVRVPLAASQTALSWRETLDVRRVIDISALVVIAFGTVGWMTFRRRA